MAELDRAIVAKVQDDTIRTQRWEFRCIGVRDCVVVKGSKRGKGLPRAETKPVFAFQMIRS